MLEPRSPESRQQPISHKTSSVAFRLPDLLEDQYWECTILLAQVCTPVSKTLGSCTLTDL